MQVLALNRFFWNQYARVGANEYTWRFWGSNDGSGTQKSMLELYYNNGSSNVLIPDLYANGLVSGERAAYVASTGELRCNTSIRDTKTNIVDATLEQAEKLYDLNIREFEFRIKGEDNKLSDEGSGDKQYGLIAEEAEEVDKNLAVYQDEEKTVLVDVKARSISFLQLKLIQDLNKRIVSLEKKITLLESK